MFNRSIPMACCLAATLLLAACGEEGTSQKFVASAKQAQEKGDLKAAAIELKNALRKNPEDAEARALLGKLYVKLGEAASAEKELRKAIELSKDKNELLPELAQALLQQGQFQKVIDEIQAPANAAPLLRARILVQLGNAYLPLKQQDKAKASFEEARTLAPDLADVYTGLAILAMAQQNDVEAAAQIDTALAKEPSRATTWLLKGYLLQAKGKPEEAIAAYQAAIKADPRSIQAHSNLASMYLSQNKLEAAQQEVAAIKKLDSQHLEGKFLSARIDFQEKKFTAARDTLQEILKVAPNHPPSMILAAATAIELGAYGQAEQQLSALVQRNPNNLSARRLLATAQIKTSQHEKALETLKPLLSAAQPDPVILAMAGDVYLQMKQYAKSTELFEQAAKASPQNAEVRTALALSRLATGQTEQAMSDLKAASDLDANKGRADIVIIMTHINNKAFDQALKAIEGLEKKQPNIPLTHNLRGVVYLNKGDVARARESFEKALTVDPAYFPAAMSLAQIDVKDKKPDAARKRFEAVLNKDKNNLKAMLSLAAMEADAKNEKASLEWLNKAASAHPTAWQPRALLTRYYVQKNDYQKALTLASEAVNANPAQAEALDLLGATQMAAGEKENAIVTFTKLAALLPANPLPQLRLGAAQEAAKNPGAARKAYQQALAIKPDLIDAQIALARIEFQDGRKAEAAKLVQQIQKQQPALPMGYLLEGDLLSADKQYDKAAEKYDQAYRLNKSDELVIRLHGALAKAGKGREGEAKLLQWLKEHPGDIKTKSYLAESYMQQKQYKLAAEQYEAILTAAPNNMYVLNNLAWVYQEMKDKRALTVAEQAYKQAPENVAVADTLGWILLEHGQAARALSLIQKAHSKQPDELTLHYHYAVALARSNDRVHAQSELERLLGRGMTFPEEREAQNLLKQLKSGAR